MENIVLQSFSLIPNSSFQMTNDFFVFPAIIFLFPSHTPLPYKSIS